VLEKKKRGESHESIIRIGSRYVGIDRLAGTTVTIGRPV